MYKIFLHYYCMSQIKIIKQNDFSLTKIKLVYYLTRETQKSYRDNAETTQYGVPGDSSTIFLATSFTQKTPESWDSMYFHARKHVMSKFYLRLTKFRRYFEFGFNYGSLETRPKSEKNYNSLWIQSISGKIMISHVFWHKNDGIHGIWAFWHFSGKPGCKKYNTLVHMDPLYACGSLKEVVFITYFNSFCCLDFFSCNFFSQ